MSLFENISIALEGLRLNKMRTFLTMLGIIIGIASVIAIMTIGDAMTKSVSDGFDSLSNTLMAIVVTYKEGYNYSDLSSKDTMPLSSVDQVESMFGNRIDEIILNGKGSNGKVVNGKKTATVNITSTSQGYKNAYGTKIISGRFLTEEDLISYKEVAVISDKVIEKAFNGNIDKILGKEIQIQTQSGNKYYTVVGVYKHETMGGVFAGMDATESTEVFIPFTVGNSQFGDKDSNEVVTYYDILASDRNDMDSLGEDISEYLNSIYFADNEVAEVSYRTLASQLDEVNQVMGTISLAIGGIAAISLLVGGIGVMNILLVSVTERTREIGVRKALGATNSDIQGQFIIESVIICIIGGAIGVLLGGLGGYGASSLMESPTLPSISAITLAVGFSMVIGVFFGYYPASKASKLNPIDALRYE